MILLEVCCCVSVRYIWRIKSMPKNDIIMDKFNSKWTVMLPLCMTNKPPTTATSNKLNLKRNLNSSNEISFSNDLCQKSCFRSFSTYEYTLYSFNISLSFAYLLNTLTFERKIATKWRINRHAFIKCFYINKERAIFTLWKCDVLIRLIKIVI